MAELSGGGVAHAVKDGIARVASAPAVLGGTLVLTLVVVLPPFLWLDFLVFAYDQYLVVVLLSPLGIVFHWSQGAGLTWLVVWSFLAGGILDRYARNRPTRGRGFFGACGAHFPAMLRLGVVEWLFWRGASALELGSTPGLVPKIAGLVAGLLFLYARVRIVVEDRRSALGALLAGGRFIRRNPAAVPMFLVFAAAVWIFDWVWQRVVPGMRDGGWLPLVAVELLVALLLSIVFASWASAIVALSGAAGSCVVYCESTARVAGIAGRGSDHQSVPIADSMTSRPFRNARILIVDDEDANIEILQRILSRAGFTRIESTNDSREVGALYIEHRPDLILLDLHMPHMDGLDVMDQLNEIAEASYLPILILSGDLTPEARREALSRGAKDFVNKPFQQEELLLRIKTLLETRFLYIQIQSQNQLLEAKVRERTRELVEAQIEIIERLAVAAEFRDDNTGQHTHRVGQMSALLAKQLGLHDTQVSLIRRAAELHDVGKIGVPDTILMKMGKLTPDEFEIVKTHTVIGARILSGGKFPLLRLAEEIAFSHHERWDGEGYARIRGIDVPLAGRIVAVADVFDALTQQRPYKPAWPIAEAIAEIDRQRERQFDPAVVDAFLRVIENSPEKTS